MSRYIDADAFLKEYCEPYPHVYMAMSRAMADAPSIDIVRCKDCKHCHYEQEDDIYHCYKLFHRFYNADEHYCSYGERKEIDHE